jgi:Holliday junction resolvase
MNPDKHGLESTSPQPSVRTGLAATAEREKRVNSRAKGARGERQWRDELRANGYAARRGQQFAGSADSPDVVCDDLGWVHFEVKAVERLNIEDAMEQARHDARRVGKSEGEEKVPVVAHRRNFRPWLVTMEAETFFEFLRGTLPRQSTGAARQESNKTTAQQQKENV